MSEPSDTELAAKWAVDVLADPLTAVLDTETTGLRGYVVELSILAPDGKYPGEDCAAVYERLREMAST